LKETDEKPVENFRKGTESMDRKPIFVKKDDLQIVLATIVLALICLVLIYPIPIEKRYGFRTGTPDLRWVPCHIEPILIRKIQNGMAFEKAGFKNGDILVSPNFHSVTKFHKYLDKPEGTVLEFTIIPWDKFEAVCDFDSTGKTEKRTVIAP
jgi:hypothetical protein